MRNLENDQDIELTFPVQRYHPPIIQPSGALCLRSIAWLNAPKTPWGSHDGSDLYRHGGRGLTRNFDPPNRKDVLPGGVIDSCGLHVPILDIDAREERLGGFKGSLLEWSVDFRTFEYRFTFGEPEQLSLDEMKERIIMLNKQEKRMPKTWKKVERAQTFDEVMLADVPLEIYRHYFQRVRVKNWEPGSKNHSE